MIILKLKKTLLASLVIIFCSNALNAQEDNVGAWYVYNGFFNVSPVFELFMESQVRTYEPISNIQNFFIRPYFNFNVAKNLQLGLGQEYHQSWTFSEVADNKVKSEEYRTTLQAMLFHKVGRVSFQHRYRYEFRFLDQNGNQRTRYRLQLGIPITSTSITKGEFFATAGNEFLINTKKELNFSQNRMYAMLGYQLTNSLNVQVGYMNIAFPSSPSHHRLQFFLTHKLYFFEKE